MCFISLNMWAKICVTPFRIVYIYLCTHKGGYKRFGRGLRKPFSNFFFSRYLGLIWSTYIAEKTQQHVRKSLSKPMKTRKVYIYLIPPYCMDEHLHVCPSDAPFCHRFIGKTLFLNDCLVHDYRILQHHSNSWSNIKALRWSIRLFYLLQFIQNKESQHSLMNTQSSLDFKLILVKWSEWESGKQLDCGKNAFQQCWI